MISTEEYWTLIRGDVEEEPVEDKTIKKWGVYVDPETGKIVSKDIPKSESLNTATSCGRN